MLGYTVDELLRIPMREMLPPEFRPKFDEYLEKIARVGEADGLLTVTTRAGEKRIWEYHNTLQRPEGAEPVVHGIAHDVTEQKRIEHELRKSEKQIRLFIEHAPAALAMFDRDMCYIDVSRRWRQDRGIDDRDLRGVSHYEIFPETPERWREAHRRGLGGEALRQECDRFERADGTVRWLRWEIWPWRESKGNVGGIVIFTEDLTVLKRAEEALVASESRFRTVFEKSPVGIYLVDRSTGRFLRANQRYCELVGRSEEELKSLDILSVTHPDDRAATREYLQGIASGKTSFFEREKKYARPDGSVRWVRAAGVALPDVPGETPFGIGIVQDITSRKQAEQALRTSEAELREAQRLGRIGSWYRDLKTDTLTWSEQLDCVLGLAEKARPLTFKQSEQFFTPESWQRIVQTNQKLIADGGSDELEVEFHRQDGTAGWAIMHREAVRDGTGKVVGIRGVGLDITERKLAEQAIATLVQIRTSSSASFLAEVALQLAKCLGADDVLIGEQIEDKKVRTLALCRQGALIDNIVYNLRDTPCEQVATCGTCLFLSGVAEKFPGDPFLRQLGAEAYVGAPLRDSQGSVIGIVCATSSQPWTNPDFARMTLELFSTRIASEIERMRAEEALRESEERFRSVYENSTIGLYRTTPDGRILLANPALIKMLGFPSSFELCQRNLDQGGFEPGYDRANFKRRLEDEGEVKGLESSWTKRDGAAIFVRESAKAIRNAKGEIAYYEGTVEDITDRKHAEEALRRSELRYRLLVEKGIAGVVTTSVEGRVIQCNDAWAHMFGFEDATEGVGSNGTDRWPDPAARTAFVDEIRKSGSIINRERQFHRKNGDVFWGLVNSVFMDSVDGPSVQSTVFDITERKRAEEALRASEERMRLAQQVAQIGTFERNMVTGEGLWTAETEKMFGLQPGQGPRSLEEFLNLIHPEDRPHVQSLVDESVATGSTAGEWRVIWPDGSVHWIDGRWKVFKDEQGRPLRAIGIDADITERKLAEEALQASEERYRSVVSAIAEGVLLRDADGKILACNRSFEQMLGVTSEQMVGTTAVDWEHRTIREDGSPFPGNDHPAMVALRTGRPQSNICMGFCRQDGGVTWISINAQPIFRTGESKPHAVVTTFADITERKFAEETLRASVAREHAHAKELETILDTIPIPVLIARDPQCIEMTANRAGYEHLRLAPGTNVSAAASQEHGLRHRFLQDGVEVAADRLPMDRAAASGRPVRGVNTKLVFADGVEKYELGNAAPLFDDKGHVRGAVGAAIDITERIRAEEALRESEERLRLAQEVANIGTFDRNLLTGESRWTKQTMTIYGLSADAPAPTLEQIAQLVHAEDRKLFCDLLARSMESGEGRGEWRIVWPDGSVRWIASQWRVFMGADGKPVRMIGSNFDVTDRKRIEQELRRAKEKLIEEKHYFEHAIDTEMGFEEIIGSSAGLKAVMEQVSKVAPSDATVLLLGETGVGKELVARAIHRLSQRKDNSFIKMNCAAIPSGLLESELFGAEKGAYTGSVSRKIGRMELADKGTIFLDEIGEIALALQPKLLRVLQDQEFERLGGTQTIKVNFRLIAATNRDLAEGVRTNQFRSDLFYRLNVFPIRVPPLRERRDDIPLLVEYFVKKIGRRLNRLITSVPRRTLNELCAWDWPGNVRELENFIERSVILSPGPVLAAPLGELQAKPTASAVGTHTLEAAERKIILEALRLANGRISGQRGAAIRLGLKRTTLQSKLKQLGINPRTLPLD